MHETRNFISTTPKKRGAGQGGPPGQLATVAKRDSFDDDSARRGASVATFGVPIVAHLSRLNYPVPAELRQLAARRAFAVAAIVDAVITLLAQPHDAVAANRSAIA